MESVKIKVSNMDMSLTHAKSLALAVAKLVEREPVVLSWYDKQRRITAPNLEGADVNRCWKDYGRSHGGNLEVSVNDHFDFLFSDASKFDHGDRRLANLKDDDGNEYLCLTESCTQDELQQLQARAD